MQSTPIDQLQEAPAGPPADEERVKRIMAEMNAGDTVQGPPSLGSQSQSRVITEPPVSTSTGMLRMDPGTSRAHVIGGSIPTMADFQAMFQPAPPGMAPYPSALSSPSPSPSPSPSHRSKESSFSWKQSLREPLAVAILVFLLNLPVVTSILSRYASWMYLNSGEISVAGLVVKALLAGSIFLAYQFINGFF
jgi:hypothetical protein